MPFIQELITLFETLINSDKKFDQKVINIINIEDKPYKLQVNVATSGLSIDDKLYLERLVLREGNASGMVPEDKELSIFFVSLGSRSESKRKPLPQKPTLPEKQNIRLEGVGKLVLVASGKGGVGKSTVSVNLASYLASEGKSVGLLDADIYGPSAAQMLDIKTGVEINPTGKLQPIMKNGLKSMSMSYLLDPNQPAVWRGPMATKALRQLLNDVEWGSLDYLILDLPPGTGDVQLTLLEEYHIDDAFIVTTPEKVALIDAEKAIQMFRKFNINMPGLIVNMAYFICPCCGEQESIFGTEEELIILAEKYGLEALIKLPLSKDIRQSGESGQPIVITNSHYNQKFSILSQQI